MVGPRPGAIRAFALVVLPLVVMVSVMAVVLVWPQAATAAPTSSITITKLASDGSTVLAEKTVDYRWMMDPSNLPVLGDGTTHYYHQGPVFVNAPDEPVEQALRWNSAEDTNAKDMGTLKGSNVRDLCELVGGMAPGDRLRIRASDGFSKTFAYQNVYEYSDREGPMVICWYRDGQTVETGYTEGMRLVWFADDSTNPWRRHVFGNWDWHEAAEEQYWYYFLNGGEKYPTTTGLSVQRVSELIIYSTRPAPEAPVAPVASFIAKPASGNAPLTVEFEDRSANSPTSWTWDFENDGKADSSARNPCHTYDKPGTYTVRLTVGNAAGIDDEVKLDWITVSQEPAAEVPPEGPPDAHKKDPVETAGPTDSRLGCLERAILDIAVLAGLIGGVLYLVRRRKRA